MIIFIIKNKILDKVYFAELKLKYINKIRYNI